MVWTPSKEAQDRNRINCRRIHLMKNYNMTIEEYDDMWKQQEYKCKICGSDKINGKENSRFINFPVDHCHKSGRVRGILCTSCNNRLGGFEALLPYLGTVIEYLGLNLKVVADDESQE